MLSLIWRLECTNNVDVHMSYDKVFVSKKQAEHVCELMNQVILMQSVMGITYNGATWKVISTEVVVDEVELTHRLNGRFELKDGEAFRAVKTDFSLVPAAADPAKTTWEKTMSRDEPVWVFDIYSDDMYDFTGQVKDLRQQWEDQQGEKEKTFSIL